MEPNEHDGNDGFDVTDINRRKLLQGVGTAGAIGVLGTGSAAARHKGSGPQEKCDCIDDADAWGKYDFECVDYDDEDEECDEWGFVLTEGDDVIDNITVTNTKDHDDSEPITVTYEAVDGYAVTEVCAFGGTSNDEDEDPDGESSFDLENNGGKQAAISNLTFCVEEPEVPPSDKSGWQVDLIYGEPNENLCKATYGSEGRLLQALWADPENEEGRLEDQWFDDKDYAYDQCDAEIVQDITFDPETGLATATLDPGSCSCDDFDLVSYDVEGYSFTCDQDLVGSAQGYEGTHAGTVVEDGDGNCVFGVGVPDGGD